MSKKHDIDYLSIAADITGANKSKAKWLDASIKVALASLSEFERGEVINEALADHAGHIAGLYLSGDCLGVGEYQWGKIVEYMTTPSENRSSFWRFCPYLTTDQKKHIFEKHTGRPIEWGDDLEAELGSLQGYEIREYLSCE